MMAAVDKFAPVKRSDGYALNEWRLDFHLDNWRRFEHRDEDGPGFSISDGHSMSKDFEDMCSQMDRNAAETTAAAIASLAPVERAAVFCKLVAAVYRFPRESLQNAWIRARWRLARDLYLRHLV